MLTTSFVRRFAAAAAPSLNKNGVISLKFQDLVAGKDLSRSVEVAYNKDGLGLLVVTGVPGFVEKRRRLLPLGRRFAEMSDAVKSKYEHKDSLYSFGWSHGKEKFEGKPDVAKGSFYANPQYNHSAEDAELIRKFPEYCMPNIWPRAELPELEGAFRDLGQLMVSVGLLVAQQCDRYVGTLIPSYQADKMHNTITSSLACKARLLHYFPRSPAELTSEDSWCGWHQDHGTLTGLTPAMFVNPALEEVASPDPSSGLYVRSRTGEVVKVAMNRDEIAFQMGQTSQVHTGGKLVATPHMVKAPGTAGNISRDTFAVFMQPSWDAPMDIPKGIDVKSIGVDMWKAGTDFSEFTKAVMSNYY